MVTIPLKQDFQSLLHWEVDLGIQDATARGMASKSSKTRITPFTKKNMKQRDPQGGPIYGTWPIYCSLTWLNRDCSGRIAMDIDENYHE